MVFKKGEHPSIKTEFKKGIKRESMNKETRNKISIANKGKIRSIEMKNRMSIIRKGLYKGEKNPFYGKKHTEEIKKYISETGKGRIPWNKGKKWIERMGKNNHNWKGGVSDESNKRRHSFEWKEWRLKVFSRDNYTCQHCNKRGVYLHPHHIIQISECIRLNKREEIFNVNNGLTLCVDCHLKKGLHRGID